jgi:hypothetical protein
MVTRNERGDLNFLFHTEHGFFKRERKVIQEVITGTGSGPGTRRTSESEPEKLLKDVTERAEDILIAPEPAEAGTPQPFMPIGVVNLPFLGVPQDLISFGGFLEAFLGFLVARVSIGMVFEGQFSVGLLDLFLFGLSRDPQHFIIVTLIHITSIPLSVFHITLAACPGRPSNC